jgi:phage recombination protein Bet
MNHEKQIRYMTDTGEVILSQSIVQKYLVSGGGAVTQNEVIMFMQLCKYQFLNPFLREAYLIKFGNSPATIITGKEVFTKRASKNQNFVGFEAGIVVYSNNEIIKREGTIVLKTEELVGGWAKVYRSDYTVPMESTASMEEYARYNAKGELMKNWKDMPATMIRKVALVQALREAFPDQFQGLYSPEEMPVDNSKLDSKPINLEIDEQQKNINVNESNNTTTFDMPNEKNIIDECLG